MNRYKIVVFNCGMSTAFMIEGFDLITALQCGQFSPNDVIRAELVDTSNVVDTTVGI